MPHIWFSSFAVVSCGGPTVLAELMIQLKEHQQTLTEAFSNTVGGNREGHTSAEGWREDRSMGFLGKFPLSNVE